MLALAIAFLAVLTPFVFTHGFFSPGTQVDGLFIDLGYQLNLGQTVVVRAILYTSS